MFSVPDLIRLARIYCAATGVSAATLGKKSCRNNRVFVRLFAEDNPRLLSDTAEKAGRWLVQNWPQDACWPKDIPHPGHEPDARGGGLAESARRDA